MSRADDPALLSALVELGGGAEPAWLVGGAIRDALLGQPRFDYDVIVVGDAERPARQLARRLRGHAFSLSDAYGAWRVVAAAGQLDLTPMQGTTLEQDLRRRDLAINAIAQPLRPGLAVGRGAMVDPCGGIADLAARRLRTVGDESFSADPLRVIRVSRFVAELGFDVDPDTFALARASAGALCETSAERVFTELRLLLCGPHAIAGLRSLQETAAMATVLPELEALRGVRQSNYHHLDVYEHTLATLAAAIELSEQRCERFPCRDPRVRSLLREPLANELTRGQALRFGALLHDIAKPLTRAVTDEGRVTFHAHDVRGAELATEILTRLRASDRLARHVAALTRDHLRLGFLVHSRPLDRRAVYAYMAATEPVEVDVTLLSVADRLATLGRNAEQAVAAHLELARELLPVALDWHLARPKPPIRGDRLARALEIAPGPELGLLLERLTQAAYAGEIAGEPDAIAYARRLGATSEVG